MTRRIVLALMLAMSAPAGAAAHDIDLTSIARVFLDQVGEHRYVFSVLDTKLPPGMARKVALPEGCAALAPETARSRVASGFVFECDRELTFDDVITLPWPLAGVVVLAGWHDGTYASAFFRGDGQSIAVPLEELSAAPGSLQRLAGRYFRLGTEHILLGVDHLLFVLGLLLLVRGFPALLKTVTAFTVAHSLTLGAAVLGYIPVDRAPVEAAIALSIVLLAREIVMGRRGHVHLVHRQPWVVAFVFGLLHGLGFAGALGQLGLRSADVPLALLFFNLGVEAGQIAFVTALLSLHRAARRMSRSLSPRLEPALGYALGALAMLWLFDRLPAVFALG